MGMEYVTQKKRKGNGITMVKKKSNKFKRHFSHRFMRVPESWRRPRGIESVVRCKFNGEILMPNIGYGSNKKTKHLLPQGMYKFTISNLAELEMLMMHNGKYLAEIAHNVSSRKRSAILERATQLNITVSNANAKLAVEEDE